MKRAVFFALIAALLMTACLQGLPSPLVTAPAPASAPEVEQSQGIAPTIAPPKTAEAPAIAAPSPAAPAPATVPDLGAVLPLDPTIRYGKLDNGLTYYVRQNTEPAKRAELWLVVNAGSVLEDDDQKGLAHFVEHMLFNGTRRFPDGELIKFLQSIGVEFGPDVNASTSFDETVYNLQVPTEDDKKFGTALDVLQDWAGSATLSDQEIDKERGVIVEEWRLRDQTASGRMWDKMIPTVLGGSRYAERMPIGDMEIVRNAPPDALRRFYQKWYRPDLMAVIAVGDFDPAKVEGMIRERFSTLPVPDQPAARPTFDVPAQPGTRYLVVKDPENPDTTLEVLLKQPAHQLITTGQYRDLVTDYLANSMLNQRYAEIARQADAPFLAAAVNRDNFVRPMDVYAIYARVNDDGIVRGLDAALTEFERARRNGFTETELQRAKNEILRYFESAYAGRNTRESAQFAQEYVKHFLQQEATPGIEFEYKLVQELLPGITLGDVNRYIATMPTDQGRSVIVTAPDKKGLTLPTEAELAAVLDAVAAKNIEPYVDQAAGATLMTQVPAPVAITSEQTIPELGVTEITLANGVRVVMKPTSFKEDQVIIMASSPGGSSLVSDADYPAAETITDVVTQSGVGKLDQTALDKLLSGKLARVSPYISELREGFKGSASPKDLETAFQLIYLYATQPRADEAAFHAMQDRLRADVQNRSLSPDTVFNDAVTELVCGKSVRCGPLTLDEVDKLDLKRGFEIYRDRFADMGDFTFTIAGSLDPQTVKALAQRYLGNLPSTNRQETWKDVSPDLPKGIQTREVDKGIENTSRVKIVFTGPFTPTLENQARLEGLEKLLDILLVNELREALGGTYAPSVRSSWKEFPKPTYGLSISFATDPKRADELTKATFDVIAQVQATGPAEDDMAKVREQARLDREQALEDNTFWATQLDQEITSPSQDPQDILRYSDVMKSLTAKDVQEAAGEFMPADRYVKVVLYPEKTAK
jgi:zinc protease